MIDKMHETSFSNVNIDFLLDQKEYEKMINLFELKIHNKQKWVSYLDAKNDLYLIRVYGNRYFFYFRKKKQIIVMEHVLIWNKLNEDGTDLKSIAKIYNIAVNQLKTCLHYYYTYQQEINTSKILL